MNKLTNALETWNATVEVNLILDEAAKTRGIKAIEQRDYGRLYYFYLSGNRAIAISEKQILRRFGTKSVPHIFQRYGRRTDECPY